MKTIRSRNHALSVEDVHKIALSPFDSKRFYAEDGIYSWAYGHNKTAASSRQRQHESIYKLVVNEHPLCTNDDSSQSESTSSSDSFVSPHPVLWLTASIMSDEDDIIDWEAAVLEKPYFNNPYIDSEAKEDKVEPLRNCFKSE